MAGTTSIEDILSSVVDETAVSALIGSLESKLAAGNAASTPGTIDTSSVGSNHVGEPTVSSGDVLEKSTQPNASQINAVRDGPMASRASPGPTVVGTAVESNVSNVTGSSDTADALVPATSGTTENSKLGHEPKSNTGATIIINKGSNGSMIANKSAGSLPSSTTSSKSNSTISTPTTCVRIITLPTSMGGTVLATDTAASVSAMHNQTVKNTVLTNMSNARTVVTVQRQDQIAAQEQSGLHRTGAAMTTVTNSALSTGSSPSTEITRQQQVHTAQAPAQNTGNLTIREHLTSGAKQHITTAVPSTTHHTSNVNATTAHPQIVLRPAPSIQVQTSTNLNKPNTSSSPVVTFGTTSVSQVRTPSGVISVSGHSLAPHMQQVRLPSQQVIAPRTQGGTVQFRLPQGTSLPPGVMLINKDGNIHAVVNSSIGPGGHIQQLPTGTLPGAVTYKHVQPSSPALQRPGSQPTSIVQSNLRQNLGQVLNTTNASINQLKAGTQVMVGGSPVTFYSKSITTGSPSISISGQGVRPNTPTMVAVSSGGTVTMAGVQRTVGTPPVVGQTVVVGAQPQPIPMSQSAMENVKKCRNFLTTLIKLASNGNQPAETVKNVKELVQNLIDGKTEPEEFTLKLQKELKSSPQPYLIPFLKSSLLRQTLQKGGSLQIQGLSTPSITAAQAVDTFTHTASGTLSGIAATQPTLVSTLASGPGGKTTTLNLTSEQIQQLSQHHQAAKQKSNIKLTQLQTHSQKSKAVSSSTSSKSSPTTHLGSSRSGQSSKSHSSKSSSSKSNSSSSSSKKDKVKDHGASGFKEDDDINDVTSMAGVNLSEESARILATNADFIGTQLRSIKEEKFLFSGPLQSKVNEICINHGVQEASSEMMELISHAAQERLKGLVEKLGIIAMHRMEVYRNDSRYEVTSDVRSQLKFFEQLDSLERKRRDEQERELLLRAAKSRSKQEDPEQLRLKQKAKEMQQMELEQIRQQEANMTALAAIGPRKKRKLDSPTPGSSPGSGSSSLNPGGSSGSPTIRSQIRRIKRVNFRDLIFLMEQEQEMKKSQFFL